MNIKEIKSIELGSFTTITTLMNVLFSVIAVVILSVMITLMIPQSTSLVLYLIPTVIVGTFIFGIYSSFSQGLFYNVLSKRLRTIAFQINEGEIVRISTTETAMMVAIISTIQIILLYLVSVFVLPIFLTSIMQTLMFTGQETVAYSIYQLMTIISQPTTVLMFIFAVFIITFVLTLLATYIYNFIARTGRGVRVKLSENGDLTQIDSIDNLKIAIAFSIISGALNVITGIINLVSGGSVLNLFFGVIGGFVGGFIGAYLLAIFYNFLAKKVGEIKLELNDYKVEIKK